MRLSEVFLIRENAVKLTYSELFCCMRLGELFRHADDPWKDELQGVARQLELVNAKAEVATRPGGKAADIDLPPNEMRAIAAAIDHLLEIDGGELQQYGIVKTMTSLRKKMGANGVPSGMAQ